MTDGTGQDVFVAFEQMDGIVAAAGVEGAREILAAFWRSTDDLMQSLRDELASGDFDAASKTAHALKGSALNVGAEALSALATMLEAHCRDQNLSAARAAVEEKVECLEKTKEAFADYLTAA